MSDFQKTFIIKAENVSETGLVSAVIGTLDVVDKDGDITMKGALGGQRHPVVISQYNHSSVMKGDLPVGKGYVEEVGNELQFSGQLFKSARAQDIREVLTEMQEDQEWSYVGKDSKRSYTVKSGKNIRLLEKISIFEVSPVFKAIGVGTKTTLAKQEFLNKARVEVVLTPNCENTLALIKGYCPCGCGDTIYSDPILPSYSETHYSDVSQHTSRSVRTQLGPDVQKAIETAVANQYTDKGPVTKAQEPEAADPNVTKTQRLEAANKLLKVDYSDDN